MDGADIAGSGIRFVENHNVPWEQVYVDEIGVGAGVVDRLEEQGREACGINFGSAAHEPERYANLRAESYWKLRDALRPDGERPLQIPARYGRLCSELTSMEWSPTSKGKILMEPKEKIKQRIGRSPDYADALALTYSESPAEEVWGVMGIDDD